MRKTNHKTITFEYISPFYKGFFVDIVDRNGELYDVWLYHCNIGVKSYMFGLPKNSFDNLDDFIECVTNNLDNENYIRSYIEDAPVHAVAL